MSEFTTPLRIEYIDGINWKLMEPFSYWTELTDIKTTIITPSAFITDFASIPRVFWPIAHPTGKHGKAAVIHDLLYQHHLVSRLLADKIFLEGMEVLGVEAWRRKTMYSAVRVFGASAYRTGPERRIELANKFSQ
jgi:hypothetical protein